MTEDKGDREQQTTEADAGARALNADDKRARKVQKTLLEADSPELKKIRSLLQSESAQSARKVSKTLLEASVPEIEAPKRERKVARTLLDAEIELPTTPVVAPLISQTSQISQTAQISDLSASPSGRFVAKTMLDHSVLAQTLQKFEMRKNELAAEEAKERANAPVVEFHPVDSKKLAQPCPWRWDSAADKERFLYCPKCRTQAYNFDGLELAEAEALIFTRENKSQPTFYKRADGKFMTQDCPVGVRRKKSVVFGTGLGVAVIISLLGMAILSPPQIPLPLASGTASDPSNLSRDQATGVLHSGDGLNASDRKALSSPGKSLPEVIKKNPDGTVRRKRPTFGPEDVDSYWY